MADRKEYVTSLVVEADDAQVAKLRDTLQQVSNLIQGIQARGAIGGGTGGGGGGGPGGGGAGGASGGGGWGPGGSGSGGPGGWGGGQGGGGPGGGGGGQPPQGYGGPRQVGVGAAQIVAQQDEGVLSSAASALPSAFPIVGAALGVAAGAVTAAALSRGRLALDFGRKQAATMGLLGTAPGGDSGAGLGFAPDETQSMAQAMAQSGLSAEDLFDPARRRGAFGAFSVQRGPQSLFQAGLLAERAGMGVGSVSGFLGMFRPGGGGALSYGVGADGTPTPGITDPMRMENALSVAIGGALRAGLQSADIPKYLAKIQGAVTSMADKGVQIDPTALVVQAERHRQATGMGGTVGASIATSMLDIGRQVANGGGTPLQQLAFRLGAGAGRPGVDALDVDMRLEEGRYDQQSVIDVLRNIAGDTDFGRRAVVKTVGEGMAMSRRALLNELGGERPEGVVKDLLDLATEGSEGLMRMGGRGVTKFMRQDASIQADDVKAGQGMQGVNLALRRAMHGIVNAATPNISKGVQKLIDMATGSPQVAGGAAADALEWGRDAFNVPEDSPLGRQINQTVKSYRSIQNMGKQPAAPSMEGHPAKQLPDPKQGGGYMEIRPAPGMERWFQFHFVHDMDATGLPA